MDYNTAEHYHHHVTSNSFLMLTELFYSRLMVLVFQVNKALRGFVFDPHTKQKPLFNELIFYRY